MDKVFIYYRKDSINNTEGILIYINNFSTFFTDDNNTIKVLPEPDYKIEEQNIDSYAETREFFKILSYEKGNIEFDVSSDILINRTKYYLRETINSFSLEYTSYNIFGRYHNYDNYRLLKKVLSEILLKMQID